MRPPVGGESTAPDCIWANRVVWITVCILDYCFGAQPQALAVWQELHQKLNAWDYDKPDSFDPIYYRDRSPKDGLYFAEIWLSDPWHGKSHCWSL